MTKMELIQKIQGVIEEGQKQYQERGYEDPNNGLFMPGNVDWDQLRDKVTKIVYEYEEDCPQQIS